MSCGDAVLYCLPPGRYDGKDKAGEVAAPLFLSPAAGQKFKQRLLSVRAVFRLIPNDAFASGGRERQVPRLFFIACRQANSNARRFVCRWILA